MDKAPDAFRTISEVAEWLGVQPHVLRFWESKFPQIKPVKRAGGRRYYRPTDMLLLGGLKKLLHEDGLTIKGAQKILREQGVQAVQGMAPPLDEDGFDPAGTEGAAQAPMAEAVSPPRDRQDTVPDQPAAPQEPEPAAPATPSFSDVLAETETSADPAPEDPQGSLDLPLVRRRARPVEEDAAALPSGSDARAERPPKTERAARTPPPATLFDDLAEPETPVDPAPDAAAAPVAEDAAPLPRFRSRLGGMVATEAGAQGDAGEAGAKGGAPASAPVSLPPADTPLDAALSMLQPGHVPAIRLRPIYDQLVALRARMDAAG